MTGSSPKRSHVQCRRERRMTIVLKMRGFRALQGGLEHGEDARHGVNAGPLIVVAPLVFKVPGLRAMLTPYGTVPASPQNMRRALARDAALLVYPGGDHETYRASWHSAEIDFAQERGRRKS